jgi:hypothetical protein
VIGSRSIVSPIADIALGSIVKRCLEFPTERPTYSELERWQTSAFPLAVDIDAVCG